MEVIILAGGLGTRLRPVVKDLPKCMAPVQGRPFLWYLLKYLSHFDVNKVVLSVGYLHEVVLNWIADICQEFPFEFDYVIEETPLGTGGGIRLAMSKITDSKAIVLNGDTFFDVNIENMLNAYNHHPDVSIVLALKRIYNCARYGTVELDSNGYVKQFNEKRQCERGIINGGVYVIANDEKLFNNLPQRFSFEDDVLQRYSYDSKNIFGLVDEGFFIDIGIPEDYKIAQAELLRNLP